MPVYAKTSSQTVNNSTTLVTLTGLSSGTLAANTTYRFEALFVFTAGTTPGIDLALAKNTGLSDATAEYAVFDTSFNDVPVGFASRIGFAGGSGTRLCGLSGLVVVGSNPGDFVIQFAQRTATAFDTVVLYAALEIFEAENTGLIGKAADETRNNTTTLADDSELVTNTLDASSAYKIDVSIPYNANSTPDIKFALESAGLSDAVIYWGTPQTFGAGGIAKVFGGTDAPGTSGADQVATYAGILVSGANTGALALQWAQNTSNAADTTVKAGASLRAVKAV